MINHHYFCSECDLEKENFDTNLEYVRLNEVNTNYGKLIIRITLH